METVCIEVKVLLTVKKDSSLTIDEIVQEMDYDFTAQNDGKANFTETEIKSYREVEG